MVTSNVFWVCLVLAILVSTITGIANGIPVSDDFTNGEISGENNIVESVLSNPDSCVRTCIEGEKPRVCYYNFTVEYYTTMNKACDICKSKPRERVYGPECQCIEADGFERGMLSINRMLPGPSIEVCQNDKVIVDVINKMEGTEVTLHWHGIWQQGSQYYDGVPFLTQCPITSRTTFRYQFNASNPGTHFYHSHIGLQKIDGLYGSLIVRQPKEIDPHGESYDEDLPTHVILLSDWMHEISIGRFPGRHANFPGQSPTSVLINGKGRWTNTTTNETTQVEPERFFVKYGTRNRFRLINSFSTICPAQITIEGHSLWLIAQDGESVSQEIVDTITTSSGERVDFILHANQPRGGSYRIQVRALGECEEDKISQLANLTYYGDVPNPDSPQPTHDPTLRTGRVYNPVSQDCSKDPVGTVCPHNLTSLQPTPIEILKREADYRIMLPYQFARYDVDKDVFKAGTYSRYMVTRNGLHVTSVVDGISFVFPRVPPLSQSINNSDTCNRLNLSKKCNKQPCECTHTHHIKKGAIVEVIVYDSGETGLEHPFHLHGYAFHIFKTGKFSKQSLGNNGIQAVMREHDDKMGAEGYQNVATKDTIVVPSLGYAILRFKADNPGWWLFHCHFLYHTAIGMSVVFHVGDQQDLPDVPPMFPQCYSYTPSAV